MFGQAIDKEEIKRKKKINKKEKKIDGRGIFENKFITILKFKNICLYNVI